MQRNGENEKRRPLKRGGNALRVFCSGMQVGQKGIEPDQKKNTEDKAPRGGNPAYPARFFSLVDSGNQQRPDGSRNHNARGEPQKNTLNADVYFFTEEKDNRGAERRHKKGKAGASGCP